MERKNICVIGGSASDNFGNAPYTVAWPDLLAQSLKDSANVVHHSRGGLTFVRGIQELAELDTCDVLIMHFGTSIGWPTTVVKAGTVMGIDFATDYGFHQPATLSPVKSKRVKKFLKRRFRNAVKYVLFFLGLYRPRASKRELNDQIQAVIQLAKHKSDQIIWIQHRAYLSPRIALEKWVYERYYTKIMRCLRSMKVEGVTILEIPDSFGVADNYLFDCIHLSARGHKLLEMMVREVL